MRDMNNIKKYCVARRFVFLILGFETVKNLIPARVSKLIMAGEIVSTRTEHCLWFLMDISIELTGKNSNLISWMCVNP